MDLDSLLVANAVVEPSDAFFLLKLMFSFVLFSTKSSRVLIRDARLQGLEKKCE